MTGSLDEGSLAPATAAVGGSRRCPACSELQEGQEVGGRGGNRELELHRGAVGVCLAWWRDGGRPEANGGEGCSSERRKKRTYSINIELLFYIKTPSLDRDNNHYSK
jgi:hypothetical protein